VLMIVVVVVMIVMIVTMIVVIVMQGLALNPCFALAASACRAHGFTPLQDQ